jgi:hypothetical protein
LARDAPAGTDDAADVVRPARDSRRGEGRRAVADATERWRRVELMLEAVAHADDRESLVHETLALIGERAGEDFNPTPSAQLGELAPYLPASLAGEAIDTALHLDAHASPIVADAVASLAPHLPVADLQVLLAGVAQLSPAKRGRVLPSVAESVPAQLHPTILELAATLDVEDLRRTVGAYAQRIAPAHLEAMLQLCRPIGNADAALRAATDLAVAARITPVPEFVIDGAIATGELNAIVDLLSETQRTAVLAAADALPAGSYPRAAMLGELARVLPAERLGELVERARGDADALAAVLRGGAERFPQALVARLAGRAARLRNRFERFSALSQLAPRLGPETRERLGRGSDDLDVLLALVEGADPEAREQLLAAAAEVANLLESEAAYVDACRRLAHYRDGDARTEALEKALSYAYVVEDAEARTLLLEDVLGDYAEVDPARVLDQLGALDRRAQQRLLPWLWPRLDGLQLGEVVRRAEALEPEDARAAVLAGLAGAADTPERVALVRAAQRRLTEPVPRVKVLAALLPTSPDGIAAELRALADSRELPANGRAIALGALMSRGSDEARVADFAGMLAARRSPASREPLAVGTVFDAAEDPTLLWSRLMPVLADHPRATIFAVLSAFADVAAAQGDELSLSLIEAIGDCVRWWK